MKASELDLQDQGVALHHLQHRVDHRRVLDRRAELQKGAYVGVVTKTRDLVNRAAAHARRERGLERRLIYSRNIGFDELHAVTHGDRSDSAVEVRCRDTFCFVAGCIHAVAGRGGKLVQ